MATTEQIMNAANLDDLCQLLNEHAEQIACGDETDYPVDVTSMPTFGREVEHTTGIWSWDDERVLVDGADIAVGVSGWEIRPREVSE